MSEQSLEALVQRMQGRSITHGWDAVVTMNRAKVNQLLEQQYIQQFSMNSFLKRLHALVPLDSEGHNGLDITGLLLSKPLLSFETASLSNSRARLSMNVVSGMIAYKSLRKPQRITSSYAVTEAHGFSVVMDIDLEAVVGSVDRHGEVILDLSKAYNFSCDLVDNALEQVQLGRYFGDLFKRLPLSSRVYRLGMLDFDPDDRLAPRNFEVRTQAAPGGRDKNSDTYREGAVVLFVRTRVSDHDGVTPGDESQFPYLIPDDKDAGTGQRLFSGSLLLSSRAMFSGFLKPAVEQAIGHGLQLEYTNESTDLAWGFIGRHGGYLLDDIDMEHAGGGSAYSVTSLEPLFFPFGNVSGEGSARPLVISVVDGGLLKLVWKDVRTFLFHFTEWHMQIGTKEEHAHVRFTYQLELYLKPVVDPTTSAVRFEVLPDPVRESFVEKIDGEIDLWYIFHQEFMSLAENFIRSALEDIAAMELPGLDLFALNHLLFPEQNALLLTHAALPGDLALFGHIDPRHTAFRVEPTFVNVEAGSNQAFEVLSTRLGAGTAAVTWSVRSVDGTRSAGEIDQNGRFIAPPRDRMQGQAVRNVVTASTTDPDSGEPRSASALVVVVAEGTVIMPSMATIDLRNPKNVEFRASTLTDASLKWTLVAGPGTLQVNGERATYTPPQTVTEAMESALIQVEDSKSGGKALATVLLSKVNFGLSVAPYFHPGIPPQGVLRMRVTDDGMSGEEIKWTVVAGEGTVNPATGEFTAPAKISMPYSVIQAAFEDPLATMRGYTVVYQSEYATEATWHDLRKFELRVDSTPNLFRNGQQQISVRVVVEPMDVDNEPRSISESELNSIQLVNAGTHEPLSVVDEAGIPEDERIWAYNKKRNSYEFYPANPVVEDPGSRAVSERILFVQTRAETELTIAALLVRDDLVNFYSNAEGTDEGYNTIRPTPLKPLEFNKDNYKFEATRVSGGEDDDYNMETVDHYILRLQHGEEPLDFRSIVFEERSSMVQWESRQYQEDVASFTSYALHGDRELTVDPGLLAYLERANVKFNPVLQPSQECPEGALLISLHRVQYWNFDLMCEGTFARPLLLKVMDVFGNQHRLSISFASAIDRHKLVVTTP